jgi:glycosyltransferase involved in cell wall biosynthesis
VIEDNVTGFSFIEDDMVEQFTTKSEVHQQEDAARIADEGRQRVFSEHSLEVMGERYQRIFEEITNL